MSTSYDPKVVALTALGLACFAFGFSVTAVAYPSVARAAAANPATRVERPASSAVAASGARGAASVTSRWRGCQRGR
jgi:hypothetical protein